MSVRSSQSITVEFTTCSFATGAATNADSTPTGTLVVNGTDNGASVTVTNVDTGRYKAAVTLPTLAVGDIVELSIAATVSSVSAKAIVWRDTKDLVIDSAGLTDANTVKVGPSGSGTAQTARDLGASVIVGTNNDKTGYSLSVTPPTSAQIATAILTDLTSGSDFNTAGSFGKLIKDNLDAAISTRSTYAGGDTSGTTTLLSRLTGTRASNLDFLDVAISSRLATSSYTDVSANVSAIKAKTDQLTFAVANVLDVNVAYVNQLQIQGDGSTGFPWGPV